MVVEHVRGKKAGNIMLYALSTCMWCQKTKRFLNDLGVAYDFVDVDLLTGAEKEKVVDTVARYNPSRSFPTLVIGNQCIVGFREDEIREALKR